MSVTLAIPDRLVELLRTLAIERGVSIEALGEQALALGLTTLAGDAASEIVDIQPAREPRPLPGSAVSMRSPIRTTSPVRLRPITIEPAPEASNYAH
jgi:hypothetical protein